MLCLGITPCFYIRYKFQRVIFMKKIFILGLFLAVLLTGCGAQENELQTVAQETVKVEVIELQKTFKEGETTGVAKVSITVPDYVQLFQDGKDEKDLEKYLLKQLKKGKYETLEYIEEVPMTIVDNSVEIHDEEKIEEILEKVLIDAVNSVSKE